MNKCYNMIVDKFIIDIKLIKLIQFNEFIYTLFN
jgi:hypothetical protein